jgi:hypothetical protein
MAGKSQLKADIFNLVSGHYSVIPALTGKKITNSPGKTLAEDVCKIAGQGLKK